MKQKLTLTTLCALCALTPAVAMADVQIITESCNKLVEIMNWLFNIAYILGAIGLVIIAVSAFLGRFKFSHLIALGGGLFIVAMADMIIGFASGGKGGTDSCATA